MGGGVLESATGSEGKGLEDLSLNYLWCFVLRKLCNQFCSPGRRQAGSEPLLRQRQLLLRP